MESESMKLIIKIIIEIMTFLVVWEGLESICKIVMKKIHKQPNPLKTKFKKKKLFISNL